MILNPEVQRKAQAEIDRVVGNDRFPTLADQDNLPYIEAVAKELVRWKPVTPLCKLPPFGDPAMLSFAHNWGSLSNPARRY